MITFGICHNKDARILISKEPALISDFFADRIQKTRAKSQTMC